MATAFEALVAAFGEPEVVEADVNAACRCAVDGGGVACVGELAVVALASSFLGDEELWTQALCLRLVEGPSPRSEEILAQAATSDNPALRVAAAHAVRKIWETTERGAAVAALRRVQKTLKACGEEETRSSKALLLKKKKKPLPLESKDESAKRAETALCALEAMATFAGVAIAEVHPTWCRRAADHALALKVPFSK